MNIIDFISFIVLNDLKHNNVDQYKLHGARFWWLLFKKWVAAVRRWAARYTYQDGVSKFNGKRNLPPENSNDYLICKSHKMLTKNNTYSVLSHL